MEKKVLKFGLVILLLLSCTAPKEEEETIIVTVGNGKLTLEKLNFEIPATIQSNISKDQISIFIQQWVEAELVYQAALKLGMDMEPDFSSELEKAKRDILVRKYLDRVFSDKETVSENEAHIYYEENKETFIIADDEIKALHILTATKSEADGVRRRIIRGEDFIEVAKEVSIDYAENKRIELDFFRKSDIIPQIASRVFSYRTGSITQPLKSDFGYHIFKILEKRGKGTYKDFEEVKKQIISRIESSKKDEKYRDLITTLRNKMIVKKNDGFLQDLIRDSTYIQPNKTLNNSH